MGLHSNTVFKNSCLKVPIDPNNKLPIASYERKKEKPQEKSKPLHIIESPTQNAKNALSFKEFYKSIPDYRDLTHLSNQEFYMKLEKLRENKHKLLLNIDQTVSPSLRTYKSTRVTDNAFLASASDNYDGILEKYVSESDLDSLMSENFKKDYEILFGKDKRKVNSNAKSVTPSSPKKSNRKALSPSSLIFASQNELNTAGKHDFDSKYLDTKFMLGNVSPFNNENISKRSLSVPSSPVKKMCSPPLSILSKRDSNKKIMTQLKEYTKDLEYELLERDKNRKQFKANPVPIESRIPLFDKIMEDQELRRAITKLQSTAELQAQMKPFSFTEREEKYGNLRKIGCSRLCKSNPQLTAISPSLENEIFKSKGFRARPVPKNLFSNYIYEKMKEDDFYRALNRKIRAEELLKTASLPPSMAMRQRLDNNCNLSSCQKYHKFQDISYDGHTKIAKKRRTRNRKKSHLNISDNKIEEIDYSNYDISPSLKVLNGDKSKHEDDIKKIYGSTSSDTITPSSGYVTRPQSENDISAINKSNLAAILRIESSKKKLEAEILRQMEEDRFQSEMKWRDSVLRRKPAWKSLKYSHADDLTMRLQMRRDEERLRREQFLHEMELMYGRVHCQPMMFERSYSPIRSIQKNSKDMESSKYAHKPRSALSKQFLTTPTSPTRSRKVSINETAETIGDEIDDYFYKKYDEDDFSKSSDDVPEDITKNYHDQNT